MPTVVLTHHAPTKKGSSALGYAERARRAAAEWAPEGSEMASGMAARLPALPEALELLRERRGAPRLRAAAAELAVRARAPAQQQRRRRARARARARAAAGRRRARRARLAHDRALELVERRVAPRLVRDDVGEHARLRAHEGTGGSILVREREW